MPAPDAIAALKAALARKGRDTSDYDLNPGTLLPAGRVLRPAAVLIGFQPGADGLRLTLPRWAPPLRTRAG